MLVRGGVGFFMFGLAKQKYEKFEITNGKLVDVNE
jgi:hypothetical protein